MGTTEPLGLPRRSSDAPGEVTTLDLGLLRLLARGLGSPELDLALWNGFLLPGPAARSPACVRIGDRGALWRLLLHPMLGFGDLYSAGRVEVEGDLVAGLEAVNRAASVGRLGRWLGRLERFRANSPGRAQGNIHHHYDLGNAFYALWLDRAAMQYTCAYYPTDTLTLEQAQTAKMHHVCRKLRLRADERVVEAGCGWGGFALFMARHYGVRVRAYNISHEQIAYARRRAHEEGLEDRVEFVESDYRNIEGRYDAFVSVGMLEHVGPRCYGALGRVIDRCLAPHGRGLIHSIGRNEPYPLNPWIRRRIFPGAYPPTPRQMLEVLEPAGFSVLDVENLRLHYARTLRHWLERFESHRDEIEHMFDARFVRAWRLYLAGSLAAFSTGWLQLFQVVFARPGDNDLPPSRAWLYAQDG